MARLSAYRQLHAGARRRAVAALTVCSVLALCLGAAVASGGAARTGALPAQIQIPVVISLSGAGGLPGSQVADGMRFAAAEINRTRFLGRTKLVLQFNDDQTNTERAVRLVDEAVRGRAPAVLGPVASGLSLATAPIAEGAKVPFVLTQSQSTGLLPLTRNRRTHVFRLTAPQLGYQQVTVSYLQRRRVKSSALLYIQEGAANAEWAQKILPPLLSKSGISVTDTIGFSVTQTDFSALATRLAQSAPDAIGMSTFASQSSTLVSQLRRAGYRGILYADQSFGGNSLEAAGSLANGAVWATDYAPFMTTPSSVAFTKAWRNAKKADPLNFNAEGYDTVWFLARALKIAQSTDRAKVRNAMQTVTGQGMNGAVGRITFKRTHDAFVDGVLVQWLNGEVAPVR